MKSLQVALSLLTVIPARPRQMPTAEEVARSRHWFPQVGLLLGLLLGSGTVLLSFSPMIGAFLILVVWVVLTGALHLDGLCDTLDGLFGAATAEGRLAVMKDPHLGTFGWAGGTLLLLGKFVALHELIYLDPAWAPWVVGGAVATARCLVLALAAGAVYPRGDGTGKVIIEATAARELPRYLILSAMVAAVVSRADVVVLLALWLPAVVVVLDLRWLCRRRLGGVTGDCLGAAIELVETVTLLMAAMVLL